MKTRLVFLTFILFALLIPTELFAKDVWINVSSKNFFLIGNANEKEIRQVATKLEQFRESFRLIFPKANFVSTIPTNVIVFKNSNAYNPFKPKKADGKPDEWIAGYFQPSEDVNYITLSVDGEKDNVYKTIFHEYVHYLLNTNIGKSQIPPWFNEGLAEYYSTFQIENDQKVTLGDIQSNHLQFLQQNKLIPLKTFFEIDNFSLHQNGNHSRSIFYAQAWALVHYLIQGNKGANNDNMNEFLSLVLNKTEPEKAFQKAFEYDYATMEKALKEYVSLSKYRISVITFKNKLIFDNEMTTVPLSESEANAYLGDLLYHTREYENAETYLQKALSLDANSSLANTSLGLVKMRQKKFVEAKKYLEKAITFDQKSYLAYYNYAFILSRENMDEFGYISKYPAETAKKMRDALIKAIEVNPKFTESYRLLGFISLVNVEDLDDAVVSLKKGIALQPGNQDYAFLLAQIFLRQEKFPEAKEIAGNIVKTTDEPTMRSNAESLLNSINTRESNKANYEKQIKESKTNAPNYVKRSSDKPLTEAEIAEIKKNNEINSLNRLIKRPQNGETQILGNIQKIACLKGEVFYTIKTKVETFTLKTKDFSQLDLITYITKGEISEVGCKAQFQNNLTVITFIPEKDQKSATKGKLTALMFVPNFFELKSAEETAKTQDTIVIQEQTEEERRGEMLDSIKTSLRIPQDGEKRELGSLEKIECDGKSIIFNIKTTNQILRLKSDDPQSVKIIGFTREIENFRMDCGAMMPPNSAVITYKPNNDSKSKQNGDIVSIEFVPKSFILEN